MDKKEQTNKNSEQDIKIAILEEYKNRTEKDIEKIREILTNHLTDFNKELTLIKIRMAYISGGLFVGFTIIQAIFKFLL